MAEHNANTVKAQIQSLIDLANTTTGNTDTNLTDGVNALVSGYGQGGSGGGIENGYNVTFHDENNEAFALTSIKSGGTIENPPYDVKSWLDSDGLIFTFPHTPTKDVLLYPDERGYMAKFYALFKLSADKYPYLFMTYNSSNKVVYLYFCDYYSGNATALTVKKSSNDIQYRGVSVSTNTIDAIYNKCKTINLTLNPASTSMDILQGQFNGLYTIYTNVSMVSATNKVVVIE